MEQPSETTYWKPIHRHPPPVVTYLLLAVNLGVYSLLELSGGSERSTVLLEFGALDPALVHLGEYYRLFFALFLHIGYQHLLLNLFALLMLGRLVETSYGHFRFILIYLLAGLAGNLTSQIFMGGLTAGASGAILGLAGALLAQIASLKGRSPMPERRRKALFVFVFLLIALDVIIGLRSEHVNNGAHIGGLIAGFWIGGAFALSAAPLKTRRVKGHVLMLGFTVAFMVLGATALLFVWRIDTLIQTGDVLIARGNMDRAAEFYERALQREPDLAVNRMGWHRYAILAGHHYDRENFEKVLFYGRRAAALNPAKPSLREWLERSYRQLGYEREADFEMKAYLGLLAQQVKENPADPLALNNLAYSLAERDLLLDRALAWSIKSNELTDYASPIYVDTLAWVFYKQGNYEEAEKYMTEVVESSDEAVFLFHLGAIKVALGEEAQGRGLIQEALEQGLDWWEREQAEEILKKTDLAV